MITDWMVAAAQQFLPAQDTGLDELSVNFDFELSAEIMDFLYAQHAVSQQEKTADVAAVVLDEHELALA